MKSQYLILIYLITFLISCSNSATNNTKSGGTNNATNTGMTNNIATNNRESNNGTSTPLTNNQSNNQTNSQTNNSTNSLEDLRRDLEIVQVDTDFTILVEADDGSQFSHNRGESTESTSYRSASTSKWVSAAVILSVVQSGKLNLDANPQDHIQGWPNSGNLGIIKLRDLLSFTSGLNISPGCVNRRNFDFDACILEIANSNPDSSAPRSEFYYSPTHLQVAGAMAISAAGVESWGALFSDFKTKTGLFSTSVFDLPSPTNPRLAGGMHWTATEYFSFLRALYRNEILTPELIEMMTTDQNGGAMIISSPAKDATNEDWHYGFGTWIECHSPSFDCSGRQRVSSPGAYGAYPFIDFENKYFGIIAREGALGSYVNGYNLFVEVSPKLESWARAHQTN